MSSDNHALQTLPLLIEIGSEEIPARFVPEAMSALRTRLAEALKENRLAIDDLRVVATPRRMAVMVGALQIRQDDRRLEVKGPPVSVAFDAAGEPTPAGTGFARKAGVDLAECRRVEDERGEYLVAERLEEGRPAAAVLAELLPEVILGIPFRKVMRWGDYDLEYPRPLQWLTVLLGDEVVPVRLGYLEAGRSSRGHRTLARDKQIEITRADDYLEAVRGLGVIVDHRERRRMIEEGLATRLSDVEGDLVNDDELLEEVVFLCEHPTPFLGKFDAEFLAVPDRVVTTALKAHQRYFSITRSGGGGLVPLFAAVRDGGPDHLVQVVEGNERVLRARLADALFYWEFDQQKSPDQMRDMLRSVTWLEGYGSVGEKTDRLEGLVAWLWTAGMGDRECPTDLVRAAAISKCDLVSEMIKDGKEFTKLEGFIGARYAELAGESAAVCTAVERHHLPRSAAGELPGDALSATLAIADRLDNIAGCWLAGFAPTGAKDPYALRRQVLAVLRILLDAHTRLNLADALDRALENFASITADGDRREAREEIFAFVLTRMTGYYNENLERDADVLRAVLPVRWSDPSDALAWAEALERYRDQPDFQLLATGFKRCRNILEGRTVPVSELAACRDRWTAGGQGAEGEDFKRLPESAEKVLLARVVATVPKLVEAEADGDYDRVFALFSELGPTIDAFFDKVRVNVDDRQLKSLRHAFLREIHGLFAGFADFSAVAPAENPE